MSMAEQTPPWATLTSRQRIALELRAAQIELMLGHPGRVDLRRDDISKMLDELLLDRDVLGLVEPIDRCLECDLIRDPSEVERMEIDQGVCERCAAVLDGDALPPGRTTDGRRTDPFTN